jgi:hypothetical protein
VIRLLTSKQRNLEEVHEMTIQEECKRLAEYHNEQVAFCKAVQAELREGLFPLPQNHTQWVTNTIRVSLIGKFNIPHSAICF